MRLYSEDANWFHLLTHPDDYAIEAADYTRLIKDACPDATTLLELGSGGGNNASHIRVELDHHVCGLFSREDWVATLESAGFSVETPPLDPVEHDEQVAFVCKRPVA